MNKAIRRHAAAAAVAILLAPDEKAARELVAEMGAGA